MIYERKYPIAQMNGEFVLLSWERGYKNIELFYKERELVKLSTNQKLKKGFSFIDKELGKIEMKYSEKPISIDIIFDGVHSPVNASHPLKKIKTISNYFWMFAAFCLVAAIIMMLIFPIPQFRLVIAVEEAIFIGIYVISAVFAAKSKPWAVYLGFCTYSFVSLFVLLSFLGMTPMFMTPFAAILTLLFRTAFTIFMIPYLKMASQISSYKKYGQVNSALLDDKL